MSMNPITGLFRINWSSRKMRSLDLSLAIGALLYGLYDGSEILIWIGLAAIVFSILNPMGRLQKGVKGFVKPADKK